MPHEDYMKALKAGRKDYHLHLSRGEYPYLQVLDEITSALDPQTAGALMDTVLALEGVGLLAITHDLNGERLKRFDSILVLRDGSIIEQGSWEALMAQRGELYRLSVRT